MVHVRSAIIAMNPRRPPTSLATRSPEHGGRESAAPDGTAGAFVGRERELGELQGALEAAAGSRGRLYMIVGEPGIGKTRLADEVCAHATARGVLPLWGRCCEDGGAPAYWPWIQIIRAYARTCDPSALATQLGRRGVDVAQMVPELRELVPALGTGSSEPAADAERARFHLFDATATFLRNAAGDRPLVLVLDDLHAADRPSLLLLQLIARELRDAPILVLGCYRDVEVRRQPDLAAVLGDLARDAIRVPLRGLGQQDVARFIAQSVGRYPTLDVAAAVHQATDGNPFFVDEVVRLLAADGRFGKGGEVSRGPLGIPDGVREAILRRLGQLSPACCAVLRLAAVFGREFDLVCVERAGSLVRTEVLAALDEAMGTGIVRDLPATPGRFSFSHALVRDALYAGIPSARRLELHRHAGEVLEEIHGTDVDPHLPEIAYHFHAAVPAGDATTALAYCVRAAERASRSLGCEEAIAHYQRALDILRVLEPDEARRCELLLALAKAEDLAGNIDGATATFSRAAHVARQLGRPDLLARAALGAGGQWATKFTASPFDKSDLELLQEALAAVGSTDGPSRARLLSRFALSLYLAGRQSQGGELSAEAVEMARRLGDVDTIAYALRARHGVLLGPDHLELRLAVSSELTALARDAGNRELALRAHALRTLDLLEAGEIDESFRHLLIHARLAEELREPFDLWLNTVWRAARMLLHGQIAQSEQLAFEAYAMAKRTGGQQAAVENAGACFLVSTFLVRREQGRLAEVIATAEDFAQRYAIVPGFRCILANAYTELGREADGRREFERLAADDFASLPRDSNWIGEVAILADTAVALRDERRAAVLYDLMLPFERRVAFAGSPGAWGSVARALGRLATLLGRWDDAARHFELGLDTDRRLEGRPWLAHGQRNSAEMRLARDAPGDREAAGVLLERALAAARELGLSALERSTEALVARSGGSDQSTVPESAAAGVAVSAASGTVFRQEGDYWTIEFDGVMVRLRAGRGLELLAHLLRHPGRALHALDLVSAGPADSADRSATAGEGDLHAAGLRISRLADAGVVIDARAATAYRARLRDLTGELATAEESHDSGHVERLRAEIDQLSRELARGFGLGGRQRRAGSAAERARLSATRAIRTALARICHAHPTLGRHLARTVKTGTFCCYAPDPRLPVRWER
jgi:tetratricopeptide (TPR) repeat protein